MLHEVKFKSFNKRDDVYGWIYVPACKPKGIMQLVHGFGEHSRRYFHMIVALMDAGYIVAADDHVGHGKTATENDVWSDWGDAGPHTQMEDEYSLTKIVKEKYPNLPYFIYGHSMGSMIVRDYISKYSDGLSGAIICGTPAKFKGLDETIAKLEAEIKAGKGEERDPELTGMFMGWMCERMGEVSLGNEWICHSKEVQLDHANDPFDAFTKPTSTRSLYDFAMMMKVIDSVDWAKKVPTSLPIYNIGGDEDPVTYYGEGIYQVTNWLLDTGHNVRTKVYCGYRHEIHNYDEIKCEVEAGIIDFMNSNI